MKKIKPPWLTRSDEVYIEGSAWEQFADWISWVQEQFVCENPDELWENMDTDLETQLYIAFNNLITEIEEQLNGRQIPKTKRTC